MGTSNNNSEFRDGSCDTLLVELLAIRLGEPTTLAKSLVMAKPAVCGSSHRLPLPHQSAAHHRVEATPQGAWSAATETYRIDRRESEHRANAAMRPKNEFVEVPLCF